MDLISHLKTWYTLPQPDGYVIRDAPVRPDQLPDPKFPESAELARYLREAMPDAPQVSEAVEKHGMHALWTVNSVESAQESLGLDEISAQRLMAVMRFGEKRYAPQSGSIPLIRSIDDVYRHCYGLVHRSQEHLHILMVNNRYQLIHEQTVGIGDLQGMKVRIPDILQAVLQREVRAFVLVHNHPSGDPAPSTEDVEFSQDLLKAAAYFNIELLDHVIVASGGCSSALKLP
jgi:DNA repair protein RadC